MKVKFNIVDPETNPDLSSNSEEIFSDLDNIKETTIPQSKNYATLEKTFGFLMIVSQYMVVKNLNKLM